MTQTILYLHGFNSSPDSMKAQLLKKAIVEKKLDCHYICPQLTISPAKSLEIAQESIKNIDPTKLTVIGSSLGGFLATYLAEKLSCKAVLLNPVVTPWKIKILDDLPEHPELEVKQWLAFREKYAQELNDLTIKKITNPQRYFLMAATGDELLDYSLMVEQFKDAKQIVIQGDNHGLESIVDHLDTIFKFCGITRSK